MPQRVILIAAVTVDGYVARHSLEITKWSKDLHLFKEQTMGWPIIMGSNTYKTLSNELPGRRSIIVHRDDDPASILEGISAYQCFIIGCGRTYHKFIKQLTHVYVTPHPHVFGGGIRLFEGPETKEMDLGFIRLVEVSKERGIYQYQYKVKKK